MRIKKMGFISILFALIFLASALQSDQTYVYTIEKDGLYVSPLSLSLFVSPFSVKSNLDEGSFRADLVGGEELFFSVKFDFEDHLHIDPSKECFTKINSSDCVPGRDVRLVSSSVVLNLPYVSGATAIDVFHEDKFLFRTELVGSRGFFGAYWIYIISGMLLVILLFFFFKRRKIAHRKTYSQQNSASYPPNKGY